jgi:hypothetical protein
VIITVIKCCIKVKDPRYNAEKITHKDAKNIYELTVKLETEYKHVISDIIQVMLLAQCHSATPHLLSGDGIVL